MYTEYLHTREVTQLQALLQDAAELIEDFQALVVERSTEIIRLKDLARYYHQRLQQHGLDWHNLMEFHWIIYISPIKYFVSSVLSNTISILSLSISNGLIIIDKP